MLLASSFAGLGCCLRHRHLRRHLVLCHAAHAGDRHSHGSGATVAKVQRSVLAKTLRLAVIASPRGIVSLVVSRTIAACSSTPIRPTPCFAATVLLSRSSFAGRLFAGTQSSRINPSGVTKQLARFHEPFSNSSLPRVPLPEGRGTSGNCFWTTAIMERVKNHSLLVDCPHSMSQIMRF